MQYKKNNDIFLSLNIFFSLILHAEQALFIFRFSRENWNYIMGTTFVSGFIPVELAGVLANSGHHRWPTLGIKYQYILGLLITTLITYSILDIPILNILI